MLIDIILIAVALLALIIASISDLKTREVPDWLSYGLMAAGIGIRLIYALSSQTWSFFLYGLIGLASMIVLGSLLYYTRQWGGGNAKLLMGLGAVFATRPTFLSGDWPFLADFFVNLVVIGALYGFLWSFILFLKNRKKVFSEMKKVMQRKKILRLVFSTICLILFIVVIFLFSGIQRLIFLIVLAVIFFGFYFLILLRAVEKVCMFRYISPFKLTEGDWIAKDVRINQRVVCKSTSLGITKKQISLLKKSKVKKVLVKEGIAFVPSFLLALIFTLILGNVLFLI